jgi:hypothetical protein
VTLDGSGHGKANLQVPRGVDAAKASIIGFIQDPRTMAISGAAQIEFPAH